MNYNLSPTINEIVYAQIERQERKQSSIFAALPGKFSVGDIVEFMFFGIKKIGRITTVMNRNGLRLYNIETKTHQWFQKINQEDIISKIY